MNGSLQIDHAFTHLQSPASIGGRKSCRSSDSPLDLTGVAVIPILAHHVAVKDQFAPPKAYEPSSNTTYQQNGRAPAAAKLQFSCDLQKSGVRYTVPYLRYGRHLVVVKEPS